ncbi:uncharacterized protein L3040_008396 [Drepanopeziza brunnea f. sp. 'multigermtubi']|uniref:uncharacterized protein n=1 Tax=Drepanopeziza brunnea f. sp. 'multigermtubi' TaxID=698441 RepID=UPI0023A52A82|nr:hypothetical protein L3040_008396 [Drepanopeziza brunnea f. sp. 'multigermtubi']
MSPFSGEVQDAQSILQAHIRKTYAQNAFAEAWRNLPEVPSSAEMMPATTTQKTEEEWNAYQKDTVYNEVLPENVVDGPWPSKEAYIGTHYQLHREDSIAMLRLSIAEVQQDPAMVDNQNTWVYTHVTVVGLQCARNGIASRIEFSTERAGGIRIRWEQSKRLAQGTLVALSTQEDGFRSICKIATVAARPIEGGLDQNPPTVDLFWGEINDMFVDPVEKYIMVEARRGYFEASRHMLVAMQKLMTERFSFERHLVHLDTDIQAPEYLDEQPYVDLTSLEQVDEDPDSPKYSRDHPLLNVDVIKGFPENISSSMDKSQLKACETMLTKKIALVQGPPGTGKTFVSVSALRVLISNLRPNDPPIIVTAQSNHALDQLLKHVMKFEPNILRLGGQSDKSNEKILKRTLYELRKSNPSAPGLGKGIKAAAMEHESLCVQIKTIISPLLDDRILTAETLLKHGVITQAQSDSLHADEWVEDDEENDSDIASWLTEEGLMRIQGAPMINFGLPLEEIDVELEQLRDLEEANDDRGFDEKDGNFALGGNWFPFERRHTGLHSQPVDDAKIKKLLEKRKSLYAIPLGRRGEVYRYFERRIDAVMVAELRQIFEKYQRCVDDYSVTRSLVSISLVHNLNIKVVGCTTTGLSKYRAFLSALRPRTLLIEEAAETSEAKIIAGLIDSLEHLILVGDHQQLQATATVKALEDAPYHLNVSMFERLINNSMPFVMLNRQRRMIPDVRELLCVEPMPFYRNLHDHASVLDRVHNRLPVPGMGGLDTYFFHHTWGESQSTDRSRCNLTEAEMVAGFFNYLVHNGTNHENITVLTFYNGQRKLIIKTLKKHAQLSEIRYFKVFTVDSYQGEENDIILLSLVRSNQEWNIGFLENKNRLVVALSRARRGLYLFGNSVTLTATESDGMNYNGRDPLWLPILQHMRGVGRMDIDSGLPVTCLVHGNVIAIHDPADWWNYTSGCDLPCEQGPLPCGHPCTLKCHPFDHVRVYCMAACPKILSCGHGCSRNCHQYSANSCLCEGCYTTPSALVENVFSEYEDYRDLASSPSSNKGDVEIRRRLIFDQSPSNRFRSSTVRSMHHRSRQDSMSAPRGDIMGSPGSNNFNGQQSAQHRNNPWGQWNAAKHDKEQEEEQKLIAARTPKNDLSKLVFEETYKPVLIMNGVRVADRPGTVRSIIPRALDNVAYPSTEKSGPAAPGPLASSTSKNPRLQGTDAPPSCTDENRSHMGDSNAASSLLGDVVASLALEQALHRNSPEVTVVGGRNGKDSGRSEPNTSNARNQKGAQSKNGGLRVQVGANEMSSPKAETSSAHRFGPSQGSQSLLDSDTSDLPSWTSPKVSQSQEVSQQPSLDSQSSSVLSNFSTLALSGSPVFVHVAPVAPNLGPTSRTSMSDISSLGLPSPAFASRRSIPQGSVFAPSSFMDDAATEMSSLHLVSPTLSSDNHFPGDTSENLNPTVDTIQEEVPVESGGATRAPDIFDDDLSDLKGFSSLVLTQLAENEIADTQEEVAVGSDAIDRNPWNFGDVAPDLVVFGSNPPVRRTFMTTSADAPAPDNKAAIDDDEDLIEFDI